MKTYHVGGINPIRRCKTLADALSKVNHDDIIELHKNINESVIVTHDVIINGNGNTLTVDNGHVGMRFDTNATINDLNVVSESKANALVFTENANLTNVTLTVKGPVRDFMPLIWFKSEKGHAEALCNNVSLMNVHSDENVHVILTDSHIKSYYGDAICLDKGKDASRFFGSVTARNTRFSHARFFNTFDSDSCMFDRYNNLIGDFTLTNPILSIDTETPKLNWKKEERIGLLNNQTTFAYQLYLNGNGSIDNYTIEDLPDVKRPVGFVIEDGQVIIQNSHPNNQGLTHELRTGSVSFKNVTDDNFYDIQKTSVSRVNTEINSNHQYKTAMERLDELIGMNSVKERIKTILNTIKINQNRDALDSNNDFSYHMIFAGNPGVGKTIVANILAQALYEIGAVPENKFKSYGDADLVAGYKGQTAELTRTALQKGKGGVIFIDEAYSLQPSSNDGASDFQATALAQLIAFAENNRSDTVVILAGYDKEMQDLMASNIGISRRFQWIQFEDYTPEEMANIFKLMLRSYHKEVPKDLKPMLPRLFKAITEFNLNIPDANGRRTNGGNGGLVRNIMQATLEHYNNRRIDNPSSPESLTQEDIMAGGQAELDKAKARAEHLMR